MSGLEPWPECPSCAKSAQAKKRPPFRVNDRGPAFRSAATFLMYQSGATPRQVEAISRALKAA